MPFGVMRQPGKPYFLHSYCWSVAVVVVVVVAAAAVCFCCCCCCCCHFSSCGGAAGVAAVAVVYRCGKSRYLRFGSYCVSPAVAGVAAADFGDTVIANMTDSVALGLVLIVLVLFPLDIAAPCIGTFMTVNKHSLVISFGAAIDMLRCC